MSSILIVENEPAPAELLVSYLKEVCSDMPILGVCQTVNESLSAIRKYAPDLVFMDIELNNNESAFKILEQLDSIPFEVVFTTSYNSYAKQACKASALDFLEKPVVRDELISAVNKFKNRKYRSIDPKQVEVLLSLSRKPTLALDMFAIPTLEGLSFIDVKDVLYFEGASNQSIMHMCNGKKEIVSRSLKECEQLLLHSQFHRIHKSYVINLRYIRKYIKGKDGVVILSNQTTTLPVSRDYKANFLEIFNSHN